MKDKARLPNIGEHVRNIGTLKEVQTITPPPYKEYIFETIEARIELFFNDRHLKNITTLNDFYGIGTSVETALKEAKEYCLSENITPRSDIEVRVTKVVSQFRAKPVNRENFYAPEFVEFSSLEWGSKRDLPDEVETVVWSSKV